MTKLRATDEIFRTFPDAILGIVITQSINNKGENRIALQKDGTSSIGSNYYMTIKNKYDEMQRIFC